MGYKPFERKETLITMTNVSKSYGDKLIITGIGSEEPLIIHNVRRPDMQQGQIVALLGASGSGKTTLLKLITGILKPTTGSIVIPHIDKNKIGEYCEVEAGDVGFVQQDFPLSRNESVLKMFNDAARKGVIPKEEQSDRIKEYLSTWGLWAQRKLYANNLSGGQRQRVAIIEQLLCSSHFLVFDEPFSGLDVKNIDDVKNSFRKISTTDETNTIIFTTHDIRLAVELADSIYVMGYKCDEKNERIPGGTIIKKFDLKETGLAWEDTFTSAHNDISQEIMDTIKAH